MSETKNGVSWLHRLASLVAVMTFLLFMTGLLASRMGTAPISLHGAAGNVPTDLTGKYAHIFVVLAIAVPALTIVFAFLLNKSNSSRYLKILGNLTVATLFVLALVVFSSFRGLLPAAGPFVYLYGIQVFFSLTVCLALFTRTDWRWDELKTPDLASPSIRQILVFATAAVFLQPLLGEEFRENQLGIAPHLVLGIVVTVCSLWVLEMALTKYSHLRTFKISTIFFAEVVGLELFLGIISYSMNVNARAVPGPQPGLEVMNATHAAVGALVLASSLFVTFQGFKYFAPVESAAAPSMPQEGLEAELQED